MMASLLSRRILSPLVSGKGFKQIAPLLSRKIEAPRHDESRRDIHKSLYEDDFISGFGQESSSDSSLVEGKIFVNRRVEYGTRRFYKGKVKAAIFDWGGTVVDAGVCAPILAYIELFKEEGVEITEDEARAPMGTKSNIHLGKILEKEAVRKRWMRAKNGQEPTEADIQRMVQKFIPQVLSSLQKYSNVIEGVTETVSLLRKSPYNIRIGSTTGYPSNVLNVLLNASRSQGFVPDASVCLSEVPAAKPSPYMLWTCATRLSVFPIEAIVKVDDSVNGIHEGLLAGSWAVGIAKTSSYVGLTEPQMREVPTDELNRRINRAYKHLSNSGAHYVIDTIRDLPHVIDDINRRLAKGEKP
ncbi:phosphonoacetaldehyde hydrolase-like [Brevipalpus obovatus]|uniref:phosphonoacetaldehyde hydrolase-like n=1 Tax=Brevipalpus obovatus TaxID=246614 RepID=UPI003D9F4A46